MNNEVIISCAVTGAGDTAKKHPNLPITPKQIAAAAIEAAKAGASVAHIHVREPDGKPSRRIELYKEVVDRVNKKLSIIEQVRKFIIINHEFTIENNMMTPTMKVRRFIVKEKYKNQLEELY